MNKMMTPYELMDLNQILTLEKAKELEGKTLLITSPEDRANKPYLMTVVVKIQTEWEWAATNPCKGYTNRQEYWAKRLPEKVEDFKQQYVLIDVKGNHAARCHLQHLHFGEAVFTGSDIDRPVYYKVLD